MPDTLLFPNPYAYKEGGGMEAEQVEAWLDAYERAWEGRDADAAARLFGIGATYQWGPFDEPLLGREAIRTRWAQATGAQEDVHFSSEVLALTEERVIAHWQASLLRPAEGVRGLLDGIFDFSLTERAG